MSPGQTLALGGERLIPAPDPIARDYLLLALRLDQRIPGLVDGYFGPAELKAAVDMEQRLSPARLVADAVSLGERVTAEVPDADRRRWLRAQVRALEGHARSLTGEALPYLDHVARCFDFLPSRRADERFRAIADRLSELVPGAGPIGRRLAELDASLVVPPDRLPAIADWLAGRFREQSQSLFGLPSGESLRIGFVRDQPWSGYNWYDGGLRSRVDLNLDLPMRAPDLMHVVAHETYPGHHLEHAWKEADLVLRQGRLESSILLINTPECLISEGLADLGSRFATPRDEAAALLVELAARAGIAVTDEASWGQRQLEISTLRGELGATGVNAAFMRHVDGAGHDQVVEYLVDVGLMAPERAEKRLSFIEHPQWRTYIFVYTEGEQLLGRWLDAVPSGDRPARFGRLLHEQVTPGQVVDELGNDAGQRALHHAASTAATPESGTIGPNV